jgi:autotransporter-associated beta strand protein
MKRSPRRSPPRPAGLGRVRLAMEWLEDRSTPTVFTWTGNSSLPNWTDGANWDTNGVPFTGAPGGTIVSFVSAVPNSFQDIAGLVVDQLRFDPGASVSLTLGETLEVNGSFSGPHIVNNSGFSTISGLFSPVVTGLNLTNAAVTVETTTAAAVLVVNAQISGSVGLTKSGPGTLQFQQANTFTGTTTVQNGTLLLGAAGNSVSSTVVVGDDVGGPQTATLNISGDENIPDTAAVVVLGDGFLYLDNFAIGGRETIASLTLGSSVGGGVVSVFDSSTLVVGTITANPSPNGSRFVPGISAQILMTQPISFVINSGVTPGTGAADLTVGIPINQASPGLGVTKTGAGILELTGGGNSTGLTAVNAGTLAVNSDLSASPFFVPTGGTLSGAGTVGTLTVSGGILSPGAFFGSPHTLQTAAVGLNAGSYAPLVNFGTSNADRLQVVGAVRLDGIALNPVAVGAGAIPAGTVLTIIDNDLTDPVVGIFPGLPEGNSITFNGQTFIISYVGGDGNDVTLKAFDDVVVDPTTLPNGTVGVPYNQTVSASGGSGAPYTFAVTAGSLPIGLTLDPNTGAITGTPTFSSTYNFTIEATDSVGAVGSQAYTVVVNPAGTVTVNPPTLPNGTVGVPYNQTVTASGGTGPYTYAVSSGLLPQGLVLNPMTGAITGTPTTPGAAMFILTATDSVGASGFRTYSIGVDPAAGLTLSPPSLPAGTVGVPYNQTVTASGGTGPYTYNVSGSLPPGLSLDSATGVISGVPTTVGITSFSIIAQDSLGAIGFGTYTIPVNPSGTITVSPPALPAGTVGTPYSQTLTATGGTGPYTFRLFDSLPAGLTLSSTGVISGTPTAAGASSFAVIVRDVHGAFGSRDYTIVVNPAPFVVMLSPAALPGGTVGAAYSQTVTATGGSGPYTFAVLSGALPAGLSLSPAGVISGTPTAAGTASVTIKAVDSLGNVGSRDYTLAVAAAPVPPVPPPPTIVRLFAVGTGAGAEASAGRPQVRVFNADGSVRGDLNPFAESGYTGGARVAVADVNGDGMDDIIAGAGLTGAPRVVVYDGATLQQIMSFFAYPDEENGFSNRLGVYVAAGDVTGDGIADVVTGIGSGGGARVRVFDPKAARPEIPARDFFAYNVDFLGGVRVAVGDVTGDGVADIVTTPGPSGGPEVRIFDAKTLPAPGQVVVARPSAAFVGRNPDYRGGTFVAVAAPKVVGVSEAVGGSLIVLSPDSFPDFIGTPIQTDFSELPNENGQPSSGSASAAVLSSDPVAELYALTYSGATIPAVAAVRAAAFFPVLTPAATTGVRVGFGTLGNALGLFVGSGPLAGGQVQFYEATIDGRIADRPTLDVNAFGTGSSQSVYVAGSIPATVTPPTVVDRSLPAGFTLIVPPPSVRTVF